MKRSLLIAVVAVAAMGLAGASWGADGAAVYKSRCAMCHGADGAGSPMGNAFKGNEFVANGSDADIADTILKGRRGEARKYSQYAMGMPAQKLGDDDLKAVVAHLKHLASM